MPQDDGVPFTPSHAAAALPFLRTPLPPAALVLGTMAPDLLYYAPVPVPRGVTHGVVGALTIDLAVALALFFVWQWWLRSPVIDLAPGAIRRRLPIRGPRAWRPSGASAVRSSLMLVAAALLGILTHLAWDAVTHQGPVATTLGLRTAVGPLPLTSTLQYASSAAGAVVLLVWTRRWMRRTPPTPETGVLTPRARRGAVATLVIVGVVVAAAVGVPAVRHGRPPVDPQLVFDLVTAAIGAMALALALVALTWHLTVGRAARRGGTARTERAEREA